MCLFLGKVHRTSITTALFVCQFTELIQLQNLNLTKGVCMVIWNSYYGHCPLDIIGHHWTLIPFRISSKHPADDENNHKINTHAARRVFNCFKSCLQIGDSNQLSSTFGVLPDKRFTYGPSIFHPKHLNLSSCNLSLTAGKSIKLSTKAKKKPSPNPS